MLDFFPICSKFGDKKDITCILHQKIMFFLHFQLDKYHNLFKIHISMNKDEKIVLYARFFSNLQ